MASATAPEGPTTSKYLVTLALTHSQGSVDRTGRASPVAVVVTSARAATTPIPVGGSVVADGTVGVNLANA